jgi:DNA-binding transcriptional regulator YiaG
MTPSELKEWRIKNEYSQQQLAKVLGVTNVCVSRWEIGMRQIPSFLHMALKCLKVKKGGKTKGKKSKEKEVKK